jgi:hypothetical protein
MVKCNVVTKVATSVALASAALASACGAAPPNEPANVRAADLPPGDERKADKRVDVGATNPVTVAPAAAPGPGGAACDQKVAAAKVSGAAAPLTPDPTVDPLCQWRIDDARTTAAVGAASADATTPSGDASPGLLQSSDALPAKEAITAFLAHAKDVAACGASVPGAPQVLRVRVVVDPNGTVGWAGADYRVHLPDSARSCIEATLRGKPFVTPSANRLTATYGYAFGAPR